MKKQLMTRLVAVAIMLFAFGATYASFPVKKNNTEKAQTEEVTVKDQTLIQNSIIIDQDASPIIDEVGTASSNDGMAMDEEKLITLLLWLFLGGLAAHRWYKKKPVGWNILFILTAGGCGIWAIVDLVNILQDNF